MAFKKNQIPWNKGLTKEVDVRVLNYSSKRIGTKNPETTRRNLNNNPMNNLLSRKKASETKKRRYENGEIVPWNKDKKGLQVAWNKGIRPSDESINKTREKNKGKHLSPNSEFKKGNKPWNFGLTIEDERVRNLSQKVRLKNLGIKHTEEWNNKIGKKNSGKIRTKEQKLRLKLAMEKRYLDKPNPLKGRKLKQEHIKKIKDFRATQIIPLQDTSIEKKIQVFLTALNIEYFAHKYISDIEHKYCCDIFIPNSKTILEMDGDYYHGNPKFYKTEQLTEKQIKQKERDEARNKELTEKGYKVIRLWESEINYMDLNKFQENII